LPEVELRNPCFCGDRFLGAVPGGTIIATPPCASDATTLYLIDGRFQAQVEWTDFDELTGPGMVVAGDTRDDTGEFWFFLPDNMELVVRVLDACETSFNSVWVFAGGPANVELTVAVTDTGTGKVQTVENDLGTPATSIIYTDEFLCGEPEPITPVNDSFVGFVAQLLFGSDPVDDQHVSDEMTVVDPPFVEMNGAAADLTGVIAVSDPRVPDLFFGDLAGCDALDGNGGVLAPIVSGFIETPDSLVNGLDVVSTAPSLLDGSLCGEDEALAPQELGDPDRRGGRLRSAQLADAGFVVVGLEVADPIPLASPDVLLTYAAVFDRDDNALTNFQALPQFALDFFQNTDLWCEAKWAPGGESQFVRRLVIGGVPTVLATEARVVIVDNVLFFMIPRTEFPASSTSVPFRVSAFVSDPGDPFGLTTGRAIGDTAPFVLDDRAVLILP